MEELLIEQKAKRYDDLLVKLQEAKVDNNVCDDRYCCVIDVIVPELKVSAESEDERIRKALIEHFTGLHSSMYPYKGFTKEQILSWFERQGENTSDKIAERARTEKQRVLLTETDGVANIDWDTRSLEDARRLLECGLQYINTEFEKQVEQNFAEWSMYDETILNNLIEHFKNKRELTEGELFDIVRWLESLKDRVGCEVNYTTTWKPSDQELGALLTAIADEKQKGSDVAKDLLKIYQQLKKLREE